MQPGQLNSNETPDQMLARIRMLRPKGVVIIHIDDKEQMNVSWSQFSAPLLCYAVHMFGVVISRLVFPNPKEVSH